MGRPVNKRKFGALADGTNITINCKVAGNAASVVGMIKSQRSATKFLVDDAKDDSGNEGTNAGPFAVGPTIAAPICPIPCGRNDRSFSLVNTPGEIIFSAIL